MSKNRDGCAGGTNLVLHLSAFQKTALYDIEKYAQPSSSRLSAVRPMILFSTLPASRNDSELTMLAKHIAIPAYEVKHNMDTVKLRMKGL